MFSRANVALAWVLTTCVSVWAGPDGKRVATIETDGVEIRAGHAMSFPAVGQLRKGDKVIIIREEETGFLAIHPPAGVTSWVRQIHLGKVEPNEAGKANVVVLVEGAEVMTGNDKGDGPSTRATTRIAKGTIVEVVGKPIRIDGASWYPITPPEGDLRWVPKSAVRMQEVVALTPPAPYYPPEPPAFTPGNTETTRPAADTPGGTKPVAGGLPRVLTDHKLWSQANNAERNSEFNVAKGLYARIYQDLWDQKAERDAIVIVYNRFSKCDELLKRGDANSSRRVESRSSILTNNPTPVEQPRPTSGNKGTGTLEELQKVFVDGQQVFALKDDRGQVIYYATGTQGMNLRGYVGKKVQVFGEVTNRPELYRPHIAIERVEAVR